MSDERRHALHLYRCVLAARLVDEAEQQLVQRGEAFFHVGGAGHEASAALASALEPGDWLHLHYRDKALLLARGVPVLQFFLSLLGRAGSHSEGRQMSAHLSAPALNVLSIVGPVGNNALQAVGLAHELRRRPGTPLVLCSMGEGSTQQGEVMEAVAEAVRERLRVLFLVHDNGWAISTPTRGRTFFSRPDGEAAEFYGVPIERLDGRDALGCQRAFAALVADQRQHGGPRLCVLRAERLGPHTNADDDSSYRAPADVAALRLHADPVERLHAALLSGGVDAAALAALRAQVADEVAQAVAVALAAPEPSPPAWPEPLPAADEVPGEGAGATLALGAALREVLAERLAADPRITLLGQDIEDPKGDVFGVTRGLSRRFPDRVNNAPLSESSIVGCAIGRALAGGRPVAFVQFADFLPLAFNQIAAELSTLAWRTAGGWRAPVVLLAPCGAYRPGLGPFHAQTFEATLAHLPGLGVAMPSSAADAAGMLQMALRGERPTVILYPKALLNDATRATTANVAGQRVPPGRALRLREGGDLTLVAWGNTVPIAERVAARLAEDGVATDLIDLRWMAPWDHALVLASVRRSGRLLVCHEDNLSAGFGAEVVASAVEACPALRVARVARADEPVPCHGAQQLARLPSFRRLLEAAAALLERPLQWAPEATGVEGHFVVPVMGSSPSDLNVEVVALAVAVGDEVQPGQALACVEADKAVVDIASPAAGRVVALHVVPGATARVGAPLLTLAGSMPQGRGTASALTAPDPVARIGPPVVKASGRQAPGAVPVRLLALASARGRERLHNRELAPRLPTLAGEDGSDGILARTGIESRPVAAADEDVVSLATDAARRALAQAGLAADQLGLLLLATGTPAMLAPSTACQVLHRLAPGAELPALDLSAACSGYLYALAWAWDWLQQQPGRPVLVVTSETMRRVVDDDDPATSPLFGDAASATVLGAGPGPASAWLQRPRLGAAGTDGRGLSVPLAGGRARVHMDGRRVFAEAIRRMTQALEAACHDAALPLEALSLVVPHQANGRIIDALRQRLALREDQVWNGIRHDGNTSSSSIPLALERALQQAPSAGTIGLCAFGAGWTWGAALLQR